MSAGGASAGGLRPFLDLARPRQWTKNAVVAAAFFFALGDPAQQVTWRAAGTALAAVLLFCLVSSGIYAINDARDAVPDRLHPEKRNRPVASGRIPARRAAAWGSIWLLAGLAGAAALSIPFAAAAALYVALQLAYTFGLKRIALLDVFAISAGFVLRAIAGARALGVAISPWLLLCTMLLALFLALCKRRCEIAREEPGAGDGRAALRHYERRLLDQLIGIAASSAVICYTLYTQWPDTVAKFGTARLGFTVPIVIFGLFRYLDLVYRSGRGERPEHVLLTDPPLLAAIGLYAAVLIAVFASIRLGA